MTDPRNYSTGTRAALATLSKGHCYYPGCTVPTFVFIDGEPIGNCHIAHIRDAKPGNRYDPTMTDDERRSFKNLVLLCKPHHDLVDKIKPSDYPSHVLQKWKDDRETAGVAELRGLDGLTEDRLADIIREALAAGLGPTSVELDWKLNEDEFENAVAAILQAADDITLRRFLSRTADAWRASIDPSTGAIDDALQILDRLTCLAAYAIRWDRSGWSSKVVDTLEVMYSSVLSEHGAIRPRLIEPGHRLLMAIVDRVLALGTVVVDNQAWQLIPDLVLRTPARMPGTYTNWVRHTTTSASQGEGELTYIDSVSGRTVKAAYLELTLIATAPLRCVNPDAPLIDQFRPRLAGFDALATLAVWHHAPGDRDHPYYPWHRAYDGYQYESAIALLLTNQELRAAVFPEADELLARLLLHLETFSIKSMSTYGGGWRYVDPTIQRFVAAERDMQLRKGLIESVLAHAKATGARLPVARRGHDPTIVTYTDGATFAYASDLETYKRLAREGTIDPRSAGPGRPPKLVSEWTTDQLEQWLGEN